MARTLRIESRFGAFLDSICDHCGDYAIYLGLLWQFLDDSAPVVIVLIFLALFGSMLGSQIRSRAGMVGIDTKTIGLFTRFERTMILFVGLLADQIVAALWLLAVLNNFSAAQRLIYVVRVSTHQRVNE